MKHLALLPLGLLLLASPVHAVENIDEQEQENMAYCNELANSVGLIDVQEKNIYINECMESMRTGSEEEIVIDPITE